MRERKFTRRENRGFYCYRPSGARIRERGLIRSSYSKDRVGKQLKTQDDKEARDQINATHTAALPSDLNQALRYSLTQSLGRYYPPVEEITPELRELVARLEGQKR